MSAFLEVNDGSTFPNLQVRSGALQLLGVQPTLC